MIAPMKFILILIFILPLPAFADEWTTHDTERESAYIALLVADWAQTRYCIRHPEKGFYEQNALLGKHPSQGKIDAVVTLSAVGHYYISSILPKEWRKAWQYVTIGIEGSVVVHNWSVGAKVKF